MKILHSEFVKSCTTSSDCPQDGSPEIAIVGRSNVGKSSLLNALLNRRSLAKVSGTPGKTQLLNVFRVTTDDRTLPSFRLVDLPGYGYAKVSRSTREQWGPMIEGYLKKRRDLHGIIFLIDARGPQPSDVNTWEWLAALGRPVLAVATKIDKLKRDERRAALASIRDALQLEEGDPLIASSAETKEGIRELRSAIKAVLTE